MPRAQRRYPPQESSGRPPVGEVRASPGPPPRAPTGLLQTPAAAGPPQRPPPAALLRTPTNRTQYRQEDPQPPRQHPPFNATTRPRSGKISRYKSIKYVMMYVVYFYN
jgi:hypothetical protein